MQSKPLHFEIKLYSELTRDELYALLQLRSEVFVVEQNCAYQDVDGKDDEALHILGYKEDRLIAYTRVFPPGTYFEYASIGRVVVHSSEREHKYGYDLMKISIDATEKTYNVNTIKISAQTYLKKFYVNLGFEQVGEGYLEDEIPHIGMVRKS